MSKPNIAATKIRDVIHPLTLLLSRTRVKYSVQWSKTAEKGVRLVQTGFAGIYAAGHLHIPGCASQNRSR